uniref:Serpin domain-containing protein n=1 Tax=Peromyscus maniculatus bairdii TaxID=230844 RepID=A0A8C8UHX8_PERMB
MALLVAFILLMAGFLDSLTMASINNDFSFTLYKELVLKNPDKNIIFSPLSISVALAILSLRASSNTLEEILEGLKFSLTETSELDIHWSFGHLFHMLSQPGDQVKISIGSIMFIKKHLDILAEFKEKARVLYQAEASVTDFQQPHEAKKLINDYVSQQTQGKIKEVISHLDESSLVVLVNYIYFKGKWKTSYNPRDTFKVPMMNIEDLTTPYFWDEDLFCAVVELKYRGNASALFILPDEGRMQQVEASLQPETLRKRKDSLRPSMIDELYIPKFSISSDYNIEGIPQQLGIREVFSTQADLSRTTGAKDLRVSQVMMVHNVVLDVDETGTEAAAATGVRALGSALISNPMKVIFSSVFLMIVSDTNIQTPLFMAKVTNPKGN